MKYLPVIFWNMAEPLLRMISGAFVSVYVARHLGPAGFGDLSFVIAVSAIAIAASKLGIEGIFVREMASLPTPEQRLALAETSMLLIAISSLFSYVVTIAAIFFLYKTSIISETSIYALIIISQTLSVVEWYQQYKLELRAISVGKILFLFLNIIATVLAVQTNLAPMAFFAIPAFEKIFLSIYYGYFARKKAIVSWKFKRTSFKESKILVITALPMLMTTLSQNVYSKADQIALGVYLSPADLGQYAVAIKFYDAWALLPYLLASSLVPLFVRIKQENTSVYRNTIIKVMSGMFWSVMATAILGSWLLDFVLPFVFGNQYLPSIKYLQTLLYAAPFVCLGTVGIRFLIIERLDKLVFYRTLISGTISILIVIPSIKVYGVEGACFSVVATNVIANLLFDFSNAGTRQVGFMKMRAIFFPVLIFFNRNK